MAGYPLVALIPDDPVPGFFHREYVADWIGPSPEEQRALAVWCWYHVRAEQHDRSVCTGPMRGDDIIPANEWERGICSRYAAERLRDVRQMLLGFDPAIVERERRRALELSFGDQETVMRAAGL